MDKSLEVKKQERRIVEILVEKELLHFATKAAMKALDTMSTGIYETPDTEAVARKIIAIVKEHSL